MRIAGMAMLLVSATILVFGSSDACAESLSEAKLADIKKSVELSTVRSFHPLGCSESAWSRRAFDPSCLSGKDVRLVFAVTLNAAGEPEPSLVISNGNAIDRFYCEQTIWEAYPFGTVRYPEGYALFEFQTADCTGKCPELYSSRAPDRVSLHLIPAYIQRFDPSTYESLLHSPENVVHIKTSRLNDPAITSFRKDWSVFFRSSRQLNPELLSREAKKMKLKYKSLFDVSAADSNRALSSEDKIVQTREIIRGIDSNNPHRQPPKPVDFGQIEGI